MRSAGIELGGTKCLALLAEDDRLVGRVRVPTTTPAATLAALDRALDGWWAAAPFAALGIASFGPLGLDPARADHGRITTTPKPGWAGTDLLGRYRARFPVPIGFDTDVAGAALAEHRWGAARGTRSSVYVTIGTGVGAGVIIDGRPLHGRIHPEIGHVRVRRTEDDGFPGLCPAHGDCIEGLVSGPAIAARAGVPAEMLPPHHPLWRQVGDALGELMAMLVLTLSPQRIALGGGVVLGQPGLVPLVRTATEARLAGYVAGLGAAECARLIVPATFGEDAGPRGAIALALEARARA